MLPTNPVRYLVPVRKMELANDINTLNTDDPVLSRIAALTTGGDKSPADRRTFAIRTGDTFSDVTPENVARRWMIGVETARTTLNVTTQRSIRSISNPATRRFKTQMAHLRYPRMRGMFYANIMEPKVKSLESHRYAHIIGNGRGFSKAYPMERKNESFYAFDDFVKELEYQRFYCATTMQQWKGGTNGRRGFGNTQLIRNTLNHICHSRIKQSWT